MSNAGVTVWNRHSSLLVLLVVAVAGCQEREQAVSTKARENYERQVENYERQIEQSDEQGKRFDKLLDKWDEQARRQDAILNAQERQLGIGK